MAKVLICDRCGCNDHQADFDRYTIYREQGITEHSKDHFALDLCGQCSTEFREFYRVAWSKPHAQTA